jgi:hypothetical protein
MNYRPWQLANTFPGFLGFGAQLGEIFRSDPRGGTVATLFPNIDFQTLFDGPLLEIGELDILTQLTDAWKKHLEFEQLRAQSAAHRGKSEWLKLVEHEMTSEHRASLEVVLTGLPPTTLELELVFSFVFAAVVLEIRNGDVFAVEPGTVYGHASASVAGAEIAATEPLVLTLPGRTELRSLAPPRQQSRQMAG